MARLNKYRNVGLSAPSPEWGTFDEPIQPLNAEAVAHKASHRRSVIFAGQNEYFGASENEWDDEDGEGDEDDEMGEYYESREEGEEGSAEGGEGGKSDIQLEAERVQQEILEEENQRLQQQQQQQGGQRARKNSYATDDSDQEMEGDEDDEEVEVTNRYRRPLLDDDDLMFSDEPRKISLTPSIAQDDVSRAHTPTGRGKKLRLGDEDSLNGSPRSVGSPGQRGSNGEASASPLTPRQQATGTGADTSSINDRRSGSLESEEDDRAAIQKRLQDRTEAKLAALLGDKDSASSKGGSTSSNDSPESTKKPGKFKSLFGVGKGSKDKEKEKKEKERLERERLAGLGNKSAPATSSPGGSSFASSADGQRARTNSSGSIASPGGPGAGPNNANGPMSPTNVSDDGEQEIITLRVYPGNVDFGASMYKTVVVNPSTMASEVANQAVVKFRLAPDGVASSSDFFLTVRGVDGGKIYSVIKNVNT